MIPVATFYEWLAFDTEAGMSARTIVAAVTGDNRVLGQFGGSLPLDAGDMRRCLLVVHKFPEIRGEFDRVAALGPTWARIVEAWAELEAAIDRDFPGWRTPRFRPTRYNGWQDTGFSRLVDKVTGRER